MADYNIKKIQAIELEILHEFQRVCKKYDLTWFLDSGTALGAYRHLGFIPWDDDIDVGMPRADYEKFLAIASNELGSDYFLQTQETDHNCPCLFAKIRRNGTVYLENNKKGMNMHTGIWIDIFPFDFICSNKKQQSKVLKKANLLRNLFMVKKIPHKGKNDGNSRLRYFISSLFRKMFHFFLQLFPDSFFVNKINELILSNSKCTDMISCYFYGHPCVWKTKKILPPKELIFEGEMYPCPKDIEYYLEVQYRDYKKLPPPEQRKGHRPLKVEYYDD